MKILSARDGIIEKLELYCISVRGKILQWNFSIANYFVIDPGQVFFFYNEGPN
jgi:hypothetical protein